METNFIETLWENKDYREQLASSYLDDVLREDVELTKSNMLLIKAALEILLHED